MSGASNSALMAPVPCCSKNVWEAPNHSSKGSERRMGSPAEAAAHLVMATLKRCNHAHRATHKRAAAAAGRRGNGKQEDGWGC
jgi:hypothetical protein